MGLVAQTLLRHNGNLKATAACWKRELAHECCGCGYQEGGTMSHQIWRVRTCTSEVPSSLSYTEVAMPLVNLLVEVLQVVLKYFFQTIIVLLNEAKVAVSSIWSVLCGLITREDMITASKFCKTITRWGKPQRPSSLRAVERSLKSFMETAVDYGQRLYLDKMINVAADIA